MIIIVVVLACFLFVIWGAWLIRKFWTKPQALGNLQIAAWTQFFGTLLFGMIVGLSIYYLQTTNDEAARKQAADKLATANATRILTLVKNELGYNLEALQSRESSDILSAIQTAPLKSDFWRMIATSGDAKWINNFDLLYKISEAYFRLEQAIAWEKRFLDALASVATTITVTVGDKSVPLTQYNLTLAKQTYGPASTAVNAALSEVEK